MVYRAPFIKVSALGSLIGTEEIFSFGFHISNVGTTGSVAELEEVQESTQQIAEAIGTFFGGANNAVPNKWQLDSVKLAIIGVDGKYIETTAPTEYVFPTPIVGAANQATAAQLSAVVTLVSSKYKDPGKYNRFYVPTVGTSQAGLVMEEFRPEYLATGTVAMIEAVNEITTAVSPTLEVAVVSNKGAGYTLRVENVRVGNVIDTQRRRRNKLTETYFEAPVS